MKKLSVVLITSFLLLSGCQEKTNATLDTSKLQKDEPQGNITEDQLSGVPIVYKATNLEEGLEALPFELTVPEEFPFDAMPLKLMTIEDWKHDGKEIQVDLMTVSKNKDDNIFLTITAHNFEVEYANPNGVNIESENVELSKGVDGHYKGGSLLFEHNGIQYLISYTNEHISAEQHKEETINIAKQMLQDR